MRPRSLSLLPVALAVLLALAGCSALAPAGDTDSDSDDPPVLRDVAVQNYDNSSHTVDVVVLHDDRVVHWTTRTIEGKTRDDARGTVVDGAIVDPSSVANTTREYAVLVRFDGASDCYSLGVHIRDGKLTGPMTNHWNDDRGHCSDP